MSWVRPYAAAFRCVLARRLRALLSPSAVSLLPCVPPRRCVVPRLPPFFARRFLAPARQRIGEAFHVEHSLGAAAFVAEALRVVRMQRFNASLHRRCCASRIGRIRGRFARGIPPLQEDPQRKAEGTLSRFRASLIPYPKYNLTPLPRCDILHACAIMRMETTLMNIGEVVGHLRLGNRVARSGWNGKGMYLELQVPDEHSKMTLPYVYMKTAQDDLVPWLCSQSDLLATDWEVVAST